ncbi:multicopper oxidase family protein [Raineyella sp. LH-20]|uniref:multicopper oxidase family protein n=1 Tax=Raineyella sp. LH-20 TaxID=3081204 RepID=UPI002954B543|nr:multicopper oxidase family protein [Raineyella sp. LH-20]WOP19894.1 multicopper oxidase family protein [Raineyella sp. LH-20]
MSSPHLTRRTLLLAGLGLAGSGALAACSRTATPLGGAIGPVPSASPAPGQRLVTAALTPKPTTLDLAGTSVQTWAYGDAAPGQLIRAAAGDFLRVTVDNQLPVDTSVHWHGVRLRNAADGVPGVTQDPIKPGTQYVYEFTVPDPGTYFFHPHSGVQLDRGLYAPLIIDDPQEPGAYDAEWVVVLDDWIDGTGTTPDEVLKKLLADGGSMGGMSGNGGMDHGSMGHGTTGSGMMGGASTSSSGAMMMGPSPWGDGGDVTYPHFLVNGRVPADPETFTAKPGQRVRIRVINAASDTLFSVALGGHRLTVTHTDGHPVRPTDAGAFWIGMGERYDVVVTLGDGAFPLVAQPYGKTGRAMAIVRTGAGAAPTADAKPSELDGDVLVGSTLQPADAVRLPERTPDTTLDLTLNGQMQPYAWGINGAPFGKNTPLTATAGRRLRIQVANQTMMTHPLHLHGPAFALADSGLRKDTVLLAPMESRAIDLDPDAGDWAVHCHNIYHAEAGMMTLLKATA